jgi:hypothetical protein
MLIIGFTTGNHEKTMEEKKPTKRTANFATTISILARINTREIVNRKIVKIKFRKWNKA